MRVAAKLATATFANTACANATIAKSNLVGGESGTVSSAKATVAEAICATATIANANLVTSTSARLAVLTLILLTLNQLLLQLLHLTLPNANLLIPTCVRIVESGSCWDSWSLVVGNASCCHWSGLRGRQRTSRRCKQRCHILLFDVATFVVQFQP